MKLKCGRCGCYVYNVLPTLAENENRYLRRQLATLKERIEKLLSPYYAEKR